MGGRYQGGSIKRRGDDRVSLRMAADCGTVIVFVSNVFVGWSIERIQQRWEIDFQVTCHGRGVAGHKRCLGETSSLERRLRVFSR